MKLSTYEVKVTVQHKEGDAPDSYQVASVTHDIVMAWAQDPTAVGFEVVDVSIDPPAGFEIDDV